MRVKKRRTLGLGEEESESESSQTSSSLTRVDWIACLIDWVCGIRRFGGFYITAERMRIAIMSPAGGSFFLIYYI